MEKEQLAEKVDSVPISVAEAAVVEAPINASGHIQELDRNFGLWSICGLGLTSGNTWIALGGSIVRPCFQPQLE